ncbi:MAG TPA: response regulator transcription factor [Salinivirgaceae bacterium]|nr:response regulator transcription factor [Salinivirgaceae bacterium]
MTNKIRILIVEDSEPEGIMLADILQDEGFDPIHVMDAESGMKMVLQNTIELVLLDVMLPGKDGFQLAKQIKAFDENIPIIFLTSRNLKSDEIQGFTLGADDYLTKPYDRDLLIWRIRAVLKRRGALNSTQEFFNIGKYKFDFKNQLLTINQQEKRLTKREAEILRMLCVNKGELVKRDDILLSIWGSNDYFNGRSLDVFITKLRKYLKDDPEVFLDNIHGVGFELRYQNE